MKYAKKIISLFWCIIALISCGGGGGGGSSSSGVRIIHASLDAPPVDLRLQGQAESLATAGFGGASDRMGIGKGAKVLELFSHGESTLLTSLSQEVDSSQSYALLLSEDENHRYKSTLLLEGAPEVSLEQVAIRVMHAVAGSGPVSIVVNGASIQGTLPRNQASEYRVVPAGKVDVSVIGDSTLFQRSLTLGGGHSYTLLLVGEIGYLVQGKILEDN